MKMYRKDGPATYVYEDDKGAQLTINELGHTIVESIIRAAVEAERARCIKACEDELEHSAQDTHEGRYNEAICDCISAIKRGVA